MSKWWEELSLEELRQKRKETMTPGESLGRYRPGMYSHSSTGLLGKPDRRSLGRSFSEEYYLAGDDPEKEQVFKKYMNKLKAHPGSTKETAQRYLLRSLVRYSEGGYEDE